ncbi:MAG TPA: nucleotidyltransferase family protein [Bryobacteraceae bacterium]|nr:nucleotidyltransferase family protein [Bryobacteraceae bacterium]
MRTNLQARPRSEMQFLQRLLSGGDIVPDSIPSTDSEWQAVADAILDHRLIGVAYRALLSLPENSVPETILQRLQAAFYESSLSNYRLARNLVLLASILEKEGIPVLAMKGPVVAMAVYGDLALRHYTDLDVLVHLRDLTRAMDAMIRAGYRAEPESSPKTPGDLKKLYHVTFRASDGSHFVDLHWQLIDQLWSSYSPDVELLWDRAQFVKLPHGRVSTMCFEDLFLVLCFHGTKHRWDCLKWLVDIAEMLRGAHAWDWSRINQMIATRPGAGAAAGLAVLLARDLFGQPIPAGAAGILPLTGRVAAMAERISREILAGGAPVGAAVSVFCGWPWATLLGLESRFTARMRYFWGMEFVRDPFRWTRMVLHVGDEDRAFITLPKWLDFLYTYIRIVRLLAKYIVRGVNTLWLMAWRIPFRRNYSLPNHVQQNTPPVR